MEGFFLCLTRLTTFCPMLHESKFSLPITEHSFVEKVTSNTFSSVIITGSTKNCFFHLKLFNYLINYINIFDG